MKGLEMFGPEKQSIYYTSDIQAEFIFIFVWVFTSGFKPFYFYFVPLPDSLICLVHFDLKVNHNRQDSARTLLCGDCVIFT